MYHHDINDTSSSKTHHQLHQHAGIGDEMNKDRS